MRIESLQGDYVGLFEALTDGVLITEAATGRFSYVNAAAARLLGFESRQTMMGADPREVGARFLLTDPEGQPIDPDTLPNRLALKGQHPAPMAIRCVLASGERRWATLSAVPVRDDEGRVVRAVTIFHDTTEQERIARDTRFLADASAALTDALDLPTTVRTLARLCVPTLADWCVVALGADVQGSEVAAVHADPSKALAVLSLWHALAHGSESLPARALRSGGPLEVAALTPELLSPAAARDEGARLLAELEPRGCVVVPLVARGRSLGSLALFDHAGSPRTGERLALAKELGQRAALALDNARLITELQHAEVRLNLAMQSGGVGYYEVDLITRRVTLSPSYQAILGMAPGSFDGTYEGFIQYIHPEDRARMVAHNKALIEDAAVESSIFRILRPDGQVRWVEGTTRIVRDAAGRPLRALGMRVDVTARQEAEARLRTSEERLRLALDAGRFGYVDQDLLGGTSVASPRMAEILGFPMGSYEYNVELWQQRIHPQDRDWVLDNFRRMLEQGETTAFIYRLLWPDGQLRWIDSHVWVMRDAQGQPVRLLAVSQDVTSQKLNEEQARKLLTEQAARREADAGRHRIIAILDSITEPLFALDWSGRVRFTNLPAEQLLGRRREELSGRVAREEPLFTQVPALAECCDEAAREKRMVERQVELPDGRQFEVRARPFDAGISLYLHDVTALKREQETQARLARHDALRADVSTELSGEGKLGEVLQRCAEAVLRHLGVSQARIWTLSAEAGVLELQASAGRTAGQDGPARIPAASLLPPGEPRPRPFLTNAAADHLDTLRQEGGGGEGLTAYARFPLLMGEQCLGLLTLGAEAPLPEDVRPALSAVADALAQGIVRRRAEQSLAEYAEELVRSNAELEQFAYVASHDLQEPLRMVASFTELLARRYQGKLDEKADRYINFAIDGVNRMQRLIQDLLEFSRVGTKGKQFAPTDAQLVFQRALSNLQAAVADGSAEVTADPLPKVLADEVQLEQLLQNLVGNALKFRAPDSPARVHLSARREGEQWTFSVRDHGIGIEPQYFERIFAIFQRLHGKQKYPGTGIGLAICKKIVERHGGRIWVESTPGQGSTFSFTLSALPASGDAASSSEHPES